jgi:hypothetical protein
MLPAYAQTSVPAALWWALVTVAQVALTVAMLRAPSRFLWSAAGVAAAVAVASLIVRIAAGADLKNVLWAPVDTAVGFTDVVDIAVQLAAAGLLIVAALWWPRRRTITR